MMNDFLFWNDVMGGLLEDAGCAARSMAAPSVDVAEKKDCYELDMDLPGLTENDVELTLDKGTLTISSAKKAESESAKDEKSEEKSTYLLRERRQMEFTRRFSLPENVDAEKVSATFKDGVLCVILPKKPEEKSRRINIFRAA